MCLAQLNDHGAASQTRCEDKQEVSDTVNVLEEEASRKQGPPRTHFQERRGRLWGKLISQPLVPALWGWGREGS